MSRLTSITLENFKAYGKSQKIPIKPLTLIFGPNSAGKSSIFHALAFLKWCQFKNNCNPDKVELGWESVSLGGISNLVHGHDLSRTMKIGLGSLRTSQHGEKEINIEWQFDYLQSLDSNSEAYTASLCKITEKGEPGEYSDDKIDFFDKLEERILAEFKNVKTDGIDWRGHMSFLDPEHNSISDSPHTMNWFSKLFTNAWYEFVNGPHGLQGFLGALESFSEPLSADNHTQESLSLLREQFIREFISHMTDLRFTGLYPGFHDLLDRRNFRDNLRNQYGDGELGDELLNMRNGLASGELSRYNRQKFFDHVFRKAIQGDRSSYLPIPEVLNADLFSIFQDHIHVGPLRQPPFRDLDETTLLERKEWEPWARLIQSELLRKRVSAALEALGVEYEIIKGVQETRTSFPGSNLQESRSTKAVLRFLAKNRKVATSHLENGKVETSHLDLGFGISTILPLVVALHSDCSLLTIEQPELHIHPKLQTELGDLLIKKALGRRGDYDIIDNPVLVETHSEHLILRILRRIRETTEEDFSDWSDELKKACPNGIRPEDVAVLYVQPGVNGSEVIELPITPDGDFALPWPDGFFEERFDEYE